MVTRAVPGIAHLQQPTSAAAPTTGPAARSSLAIDVFGKLAVLALLAFFVGCTVYGSVHRGPWLDEMWTIWQGQHDLPLQDVIHVRWIPDLHPPLFALSHWLAATFIVDSLPLHRLLNLLALAWATLFCVVAAQRHPAGAGTLVVFGVVLLSMPVAVDYAAESRSYFAQLCLTYVVCAAFITIADDHADLNWSRDRAFATMLLFSIVAALNLHYVSALLVGTVTVACGGMLAWQRRRAWAVALLAALVIGSISLLAFLRVQAPFIEQESAHHWVSNTSWQAIRVLAERVRSVLVSNPIATLVAGAAVLAAIARAVPRLGPPSDLPVLERGFAARLLPTSARARLTGLLIGALTIFCAAMLVIHARHPIVAERYLLPFQATVAAVVACLAGEAVASRRLLIVLLVLAAAFGVQRETRASSHQQRWDATAQVVAQQLKSCPASVVVAGIVPRPSIWINSHLAFEWAFHYVARRHGFDIRYVKLPQAELARSDGRCPVIFWSEHVVTGIPTDVDSAIRALGIDANRIDAAHASLVTAQTGFVLSLPPLESAAAPPKGGDEAHR